MPYIIFGASVKGDCHKDADCQDSFAYARKNEHMVVTVSDRAGSSKHSKLGAEIATKSAVSIIEKISQYSELEQPVRESFSIARQALEKKSSELCIELEDMACTLVVAVANGDEVSVGHVGDGAVVIETEGKLEVLSEPENSEYVNETTFITSNEWEDALRIRNSRFDFLAIFTDGIQRGILIKQNCGYKAYDEFFVPLFNYTSKVTDELKASEEIKKLLESEKFSKLSEDDKTLVVVRKDAGYCL